CYLQTLLELPGPAKATRVLWHFDLDLNGEHRQVRDSEGNPAHTEFGVFDTDLLRSLGGYGADRRVGQDTLLYLQLLPHVAPIAWLNEPLYHKRVHAASLTHAPETTFGTPLRNEVFEHNDAVAQTVYRWGFSDLERVRAFREWLVPEDLRERLAERVGIVRAALEPLAVAA
ncbi:MAG TPA: hypothetical protein VIU37_11165, partial [Candidatus Limnocylindrales bacterium]